MTGALLRWSVLLLCGFVLPAAAAAPQRVASVNLCADVLLLNLLPRQQIASVSWLAAVSPLSPVRQQARGLPTNHASVEELLIQKPDLVVARRGHAAKTLHRLRSRGIAVHEIQPSATLARAMQEWLALGRVLDREQAAAEMIAQAKRRLAALPPRPSIPPTAVIFGPGGYSYGKGSMAHDLLRLAGWDNLAAYMLDGYGGNLSLEALLLGDPALIISERVDQSRKVDTLGDRIMKHPALDSLTARRSSLSPAAWACGGPEAVDATEQLAKLRLQMGGAAAGTDQ